MPASLQAFELHDMLRFGRDLRAQIQDTETLEEAARGIVGHLLDACIDPRTGARECILVRVYKTHAYGLLPKPLRSFADRLLGPGETPAPEMRCLVLLASAGERPEWNDRSRSENHQAIPLPSEKMVEQAPMIAGLIRALGLEISSVVTPRHQALTGKEGKTYNVFHVPEAVGSPLIPAQDDFVVPFGVRSVLGFGGLLLNGDFYSVVLFARVPIPRSSADRFRNIALDLKLALSAVGEEHTFDHAAGH